MIDYQSSPSSVVNGVQKRDEQTMGSLQSRNPVAEKRAAPDEVSVADSSMVSDRNDPPDDFCVPLDGPHEEITEQWEDDLHEWYICRDDECSVKPTRISCDVSQRRSPCLKRRACSFNTNSEISTLRERDSHSASRDSGGLRPWRQRCGVS